MSKPVVFVIGATGNVGSATVKSLSARFSDKLEIRAGVRNPDKAEKLKGLKGVSVVQAEMGAKEDLVKTLSGVHVLFVNTPSTENRAQLAIATAETAKTAGVKHVVVVSVSSADDTNTVFGKQFYDIEVAISQLGVSYTHLRLPAFFENHFGFIETVRKQSLLFSPCDPTKSFTASVAKDTGLAGAVVLSDPGKHVNKTYNIISDRHSYGDVATALSEVLGKEVKYNRISYEDTKKSLVAAGFPDWLVNGQLDYMKGIDSGAANQEHIANGDFERITGEKPTSLKTWLPTVGDVFQEQQ
jgi:uncharacterized protein YbjT (DUF2867 family)